jgi:hypothetical protein
MRSFRDQFTDCRFLSICIEKPVPMTWEMMPICPEKAEKMANCKFITIYECGRFGGTCSSKNPGCVNMRMGV